MYSHACSTVRLRGKTVLYLRRPWMCQKLTRLLSTSCTVPLHRGCFWELDSVFAPPGHKNSPCPQAPPLSLFRTPSSKDRTSSQPVAAHQTHRKVTEKFFTDRCGAQKIKPGAGTSSPRRRRVICIFILLCNYVIKKRQRRLFFSFTFLNFENTYSQRG